MDRVEYLCVTSCIGLLSSAFSSYLKRGWLLPTSLTGWLCQVPYNKVHWKAWSSLSLRRGFVCRHESPPLAGAGSLSSYNQRDRQFPGSFFSWLFKDSSLSFYFFLASPLSLDAFCECLNTNLSLSRNLSWFQEKPLPWFCEALYHLCRFPSFTGEVSSTVFCIHCLYSHSSFLFIQANMISALSKTIN